METERSTPRAPFASLLSILAPNVFFFIRKDQVTQGICVNTEYPVSQIIVGSKCMKKSRLNMHYKGWLWLHAFQPQKSKGNYTSVRLVTLIHVAQNSNSRQSGITRRRRARGCWACALRDSWLIWLPPGPALGDGERLEHMS